MFDKVFFKNIKTILTGTVLDKILLIISMPLITRLYDPENFALFALFSSVVSIFCSLTCLQVEHLIVITKEENNISEILTSAFYAGLIVSFFAYVTLEFCYYFKLKSVLELNNYIFTLFLTIFFSNTVHIFAQYFVRYSQFQKFNYIKIINTITFITFTITGYFLDLSLNSLIIGYTLGFIFSNLYGIYFVPLTFFNIKPKKFITYIKKNKDLTLYGSLGNFVRNLQSEIPIILISYYFTSLLLSFYALVTKILLLPISILARTVGTANYKHITKLIFANKPIFKHLFKLTISLFAFTIIPVICCFLFSEIFIKLVFGNNWSYSAKILQILSIGYAFKFVSLALLETAYPLKIVKSVSILNYFSTFVEIRHCLE